MAAPPGSVSVILVGSLMILKKNPPYLGGARSGVVGPDGRILVALSFTFGFLLWLLLSLLLPLLGRGALVAGLLLLFLGAIGLARLV